MRSRLLFSSVFIGLILISFPLRLFPDYLLESPFQFSFMHRFRMVSWDNTLKIDDRIDDSHSFTRHKTSFGILWKPSEKLEFLGRLSNEFRIYLAPKGAKTQNEIFFDNLYARWKQEEGLPFTLTIGRQDISMGEGFVIMDGDPVDGSRSSYFNAVRLDLAPWENHRFTLYFAYNPRTDNLLPVLKLRDAGDQILEEQAFTSMGLYYSGVLTFAKLETYIIRKDTEQNQWLPSELHYNTFGARVVGRINDQLNVTAEGAIQWGEIQDSALAGEPTRDLRAFGAILHLDYMFPEKYRYLKNVSLGGIYLSGDDPGTADRVEGWDPVHSRWPKWSESYIYTLAAENRVAYWSNLNALFLNIDGRLLDNLTARLSFMSLGAQFAEAAGSFPGGQGKNRGTLLMARLQMTFSKNLSGHLLWEHFTPGTFYFGDASDFNWLRFELMLNL